MRVTSTSCSFVFEKNLQHFRKTILRREEAVVRGVVELYRKDENSTDDVFVISTTMVESTSNECNRCVTKDKWKKERRKYRVSDSLNKSATKTKR